MMTLHAFLIISAALFCCGLYTVMTRQNGVAVLMGVELILNAANINFGAFAHFLSHVMGGQISRSSSSSSRPRSRPSPWPSSCVCTRTRARWRSTPPTAERVDR